MTGVGLTFVDTKAEIRADEEDEASGKPKKLVRITKWDAFNYGIATGGLIVLATGILSKLGGIIVLDETSNAQGHFANLLNEEFATLNGEIIDQLSEQFASKVQAQEFKVLGKDRAYVSFTEAQVRAGFEGVAHDHSEAELKAVVDFLK
jgi:hypothetical protein